VMPFELFNRDAFFAHRKTQAGLAQRPLVSHTAVADNCNGSVWRQKASHPQPVPGTGAFWLSIRTLRTLAVAPQAQQGPKSGSSFSWPNGPASTN
jgi:hypothetical protein